jgi:Zn-dependent M16 (insulinase) family peptidase
MEQVWAKADPVAEAFSGFSPAPVQRQVREAWLTNTEVNFCAKAYATVPVEHPDAAPLTVLAGFLRNGYLHRAVREQGGAYGGGASHDSDNAAFRFYSYRDPRLQDTLDDFDRAITWLLEEKHDWRLVEEAILGVIAGLDKPGSPAGEAKDAFYNSLYGRTPEQRQRIRRRVLGVTLEELQRVGASYLRPEQASIAVITNPGAEGVCRDLGLDVRHL